jgi:hypothetical protein
LYANFELFLKVIIGNGSDGSWELKWARLMDKPDSHPVAIEKPAPRAQLMKVAKPNRTQTVSSGPSLGCKNKAQSPPAAKFLIITIFFFFFFLNPWPL